MDNIKTAITLVLTISVISVSGCATIMNGTSQKVQVSSEPPGAIVKIDEGREYTTPAKIRLERRRDHTFVFAKEGYEVQTVKVMHVLSEAVCGNILLGGPVGWIFDMYAGTQYKLVPSPIHIKLTQKQQQ